MADLLVECVDVAMLGQLVTLLGLFAVFWRFYKGDNIKIDPWLGWKTFRLLLSLLQSHQGVYDLVAAGDMCLIHVHRRRRRRRCFDLQIDLQINLHSIFAILYLFFFDMQFLICISFDHLALCGISLCIRSLLTVGCISSTWVLPTRLCRD